MPAFDLSRPPVLIDGAEMNFNNFQSSKTLKGSAFVLDDLEGTEIRALIGIYSVTVEAAAAKAAGLTLAQQKALFEKIRYDLKLGNGVGPNHIFQRRTLNEMRLVQLKGTETEVEGYGAGASKGLSAAIAEGSNELHFLVRVPFYWESVDENSIMAIGVDQLATAEVTIETSGDPLKALDPDLEVKKLFVRFAPEYRLSPEGDSGHRLSRWYDPYIEREVKEKANTFIEVRDCHVPMEAIDVANPNATTTFGKLRVEVGGLLVTKGAEPKDVEAEYESKPDYNTNEGKVALEATTLYRRWDMPMNQLPTGVLKVAQEEGTEEFDVRVLYIPTRSESERLANMRLHTARLADRYQKKALTVRYVSALAVHEALQLQDRFHMAMGWYACLPGDTEYATLPCIEHSLGSDEVTLRIPELLFAAKFGAWMTALSLRDAQTMDAIEQSIGRACPLATIGPNGFASGRGTVMAAIAQRFASKLAETVPELVPALQTMRR